LDFFTHGVHIRRLDVTHARWLQCNGSLYIGWPIKLSHCEMIKIVLNYTKAIKSVD